jgi:D-xylose transport system permease protein
VSATPASPGGEGGFSLGGAVRRIARGELGTVRVLIGIAVIWTIFAIADSDFLTAINLSSLSLQIAAVATISIGVVLVLLLGEIDLSVGAVSGLAAAVVGVLSVKEGLAPELAIVAALLVGTLIGLFNGFMVTFFGIPSFVVTLAGLLGWQGARLLVLGSTGSINLPDDTAITDLTHNFFEPIVGWVIAVAAVIAYGNALVMGRRRRLAAGLEAPPMQALALRLGLVALAIFASVLVLNADRGVPLAILIVIGLTVIFALLTERTRYGRHIFAVGGNAEAARRAGIRVNRVKISVFALASTLAAAGGILAASRLYAVNQQAGAGDILLLAIAGPVIAGTSLFGGRGSVWSALLGAIVIGSISNGMDLTGLDSDIKFIVTGAVLLLAVTVDAATSLRRRSS